MNILVTAIGSMSAACVISILKKSGHRVIGCDINPYEWLMEAKLCDQFYQSPLAREGFVYVRFLIKLCRKNGTTHLIPLTDIEIDVINKYRHLFEVEQIVLCMPSTEILKIVRDKYRLYLEFRDDTNVPSIKTCCFNPDAISSMQFPCIAKPLDGRSSEGLMRLNTLEEMLFISTNEKYIIQEYKTGNIFTVDYIRCHQDSQDIAVAREELLRTKNGAGLTVRIVNESSLYELVSYIGRKLQLNGCVNMEFIKSGSSFYLIDINPRFSAGIAFSVMSGYDMVTNHLNCFTGRNIDCPISVVNKILVKQYKEVIL